MHLLALLAIARSSRLLVQICRRVDEGEILAHGIVRLRAGAEKGRSWSRCPDARLTGFFLVLLVCGCLFGLGANGRRELVGRMSRTVHVCCRV